MVSEYILRLLGFPAAFQASATIAYPFAEVAEMTQRCLSAPPLNFILTSFSNAAPNRLDHSFEVPGLLGAPVEFAQASIRRFDLAIESHGDGTTLVLRAERDGAQARILLPLILLLICLLGLAGALLVWMVAKLAVLVTGIHDFPFEVPLWLGLLIAFLAMIGLTLFTVRLLGRDIARRGARALQMVARVIEAALKSRGAFVLQTASTS